jgi:hypothetical protein
LFRDWQRTHTQSSVTAHRGPRLRMDVRFCARQEPLPRGIDCTLRVLQSPFWALSRAPQKDPCFLLTKTYMDVRFCARQEPLPRGIDCTLRVLQSPFWALSRAPQKDPCFLLTKTYMDVGKPEVCLNAHEGSVTGSRPAFTNVSATIQDDLLGMSLDENSASSEPTDLRSALT